MLLRELKVSDAKVDPDIQDFHSTHFSKTKYSELH